METDRERERNTQALKKEIPSSGDSTDEARWHYHKWNEPDTEKILHDLKYT